MARMLITGATGLLGVAAVLEWSQRFDVDACYLSHPISAIERVTPHQLDIIDPDQVSRLGASQSPQVIVHCAAATDIDWCERHQDRAWQVNVDGSRNVARAAQSMRSRLVHISTDSVFDGGKGMFSEDDAPSPLHHYGRTKLASELAVLEECPSALVVRTAIYGLHPYDDRSLGNWLVEKLRAQEVVDGFTDVFFTPILANDLVLAIDRLLNLRAEGIFHVGGAERVSKFEFARRMAVTVGADPALVRPVPQSSVPLAVRRPSDCSLDISKLLTLSVAVPDVEMSLVHFRDILNSPTAGRIRTLVER